MSELVKTLTVGEHPIEVSIRPERTSKALLECINRGYVHLKFTETRGGTDLYIPLNKDGADLGSSDFERGAGVIKLAGDLTLDYVRVRCLAEIDLSTLSGKGRLELIAS